MRIKYLTIYGTSTIFLKCPTPPSNPFHGSVQATRTSGGFPDAVQDAMGYALYKAQLGAKHDSAKPLKGFGGAGVLELVADHVGDTFRAVYTVKFATAIYVLHAFQKKSKTGIKTPAEDLELIERRLKVAEADYKAQLGKGKAS
jgi:phage-related protein